MKYLALDIGNVICHTKEEQFLNFLSEKCNLSLKEADTFFRRFWELHDLGYTTLKSELSAVLHIKSEVILEQIQNKWLDMLEPNEFIVDHINKLTDSKNFKVALLSNIGTEHAESLPYLLEDLYDKTIHHFSCEVGARKPSFLYYQSFLLRHPEFKECIFIDDRPENVEAASKIGFDAHLFSLANSKLEDFFKLIHNLVYDVI